MSANIKGFGVAPVPERGVPESGWNVWLNQIARAVNQLIRGQVQPIGTVLADDPPTGFVGEYLSSTATGVSMTTATPANVTSVSLSPGDWDVWGSMEYVPAGGAALTSIFAATNTTSATIPTDPDSSLVAFNAAFTSGTIQRLNAGPKRYNVASTTTVYLVGQCNFSAGTVTTSGAIVARRVR